MEGEMLYKLSISLLEGGVRQQITFRSKMHIPKAPCGNRVNFVFPWEQSSVVSVNVEEASCEVLKIMSIPLQLYHKPFVKLSYEEFLDNEKYELPSARAT